MVSVEGSRSHSTTIYSLSHSPSSKIWRDRARSMRTVRSPFFSHPGPARDPDHPDGSPTGTNFLSCEQNLTDSAIDIRLDQLASRSAKPSLADDDFLLDNLSLSFSSSHHSSFSDISGELHRLATLSPPPPRADAGEADVEEPCAGFLDRDSFSTEIIESISPEDLQPAVRLLVGGLSSPSAAVQRAAAAKLRLLAKNRSDNRQLIAESGAVPPLVGLLRSPDPAAQEHAVTAVLNLSLLQSNKGLIAEASGAIKSLIYALKTGTEAAKQNSAAALMSLAMVGDEVRLTIGACGAIPPLVGLLIGGSARGKKDALTTLYKLCSGNARQNKDRAVSAGAVGPLLGMVSAGERGVSEKAMVVLSCVAGAEAGRRAIVQEGGIPALVEAVEDGSPKGREFAVVTLLQLCADCVRNRELVVAEGGIPPLVALSQAGTARAKHKAETLLRYLREPRHQEASSSTP